MVYFRSNFIVPRESTGALNGSDNRCNGLNPGISQGDTAHEKRNNTAPITAGIIIGLETCLTLAGLLVDSFPPELEPSELAAPAACGVLK